MRTIVARSRGVAIGRVDEASLCLPARWWRVAMRLSADLRLAFGGLARAAVRPHSSGTGVRRVQPKPTRIMKKLALVLLLSTFAAASFAQASAPAAGASAPKHKFLKKLKAHKPAASATNPETSADKKGGA
jgi:hypothetical protein